MLRSTHCDALLVSCSLPMNLPGTLPIIEAGHGLGRPVIVGGRGFGGDDTRAAAHGVAGARA
jgi:hypothetical protein